MLLRVSPDRIPLRRYDRAVHQLRSTFLTARLDVRHLVDLEAFAWLVAIEAAIVRGGDLLSVRITGAGFSGPSLCSEKGVDDRSVDSEN